MCVAVVLVHGAEQVANLPRIRAACAGLDGIVIVSGAPISGATPPSTVPGFNAGANRDIGIAEARRRYPGCSVVLLDGDCVPSHRWAADHRAACSVPHPLVTCGARHEGDARDPRESSLSWRGMEYPPSFTPSGRSEFSLEEVLAHRVTWTCNLSINAAALDILERAGESMHGCPRIFAPMFDGLWGGEDTALGVLALYTGCSIRTLPASSSFVDHQPHPSRIVSVKNLRAVHDYAKQVAAHYYITTDPTHTTGRSSMEQQEDTQAESTQPRFCSPELLKELRTLERHAKAYEAQAQVAVAQAEALRNHGSLRAQELGELVAGESLDLATGLIVTLPTK